jgi:fatty-acid peroxygenase
MTIASVGQRPARYLPHDRLLDCSLAVAFETYNFISNRRRSLGSDIFGCRLLLRPAVCLGGPGAAQLFYDAASFRRAGVVPRPVLKTLLGEGGVHGLDDAAHRQRKAMFLSFMGPNSIGGFRQAIQACWQAAVANWPRTVPIFDEARRILFCAVMDWASVPYSAEEVESRSSDLMAMVDAFGSLGIRHIQGRIARRRSEHWIKSVVARTRARELRAKDGSALGEIARQPLPLPTAAVELLNVIRPMMAAAYFAEVAAAALHLHGYLRTELLSDPKALECFVNEVRRFTAFTPFLGAEACRDVAWQGYMIPKGTLAVLDVYGIHRDERIWPGAQAFDPVRFANWNNDPFSLLQQGGGYHETGHRCAGEWLTIEALKVISQGLAHQSFTTTTSNLLFDLKRVPARLRQPVILELT